MLVPDLTVRLIRCTADQQRYWRRWETFELSLRYRLSFRVRSSESAPKGIINKTRKTREDEKMIYSHPRLVFLACPVASIRENLVPIMKQCRLNLPEWPSGA